MIGERARNQKANDDDPDFTAAEMARRSTAFRSA
jgi:hypothetical protein